MAGVDETSHSASISTTSYETALCVIPSQHACQDIENLRSLYDKGYGKWPPHVNLIYPFVEPDALQRATARIDSYLQGMWDVKNGPEVILDQADHFEHRSNSTIFLRGSDDSQVPLALLRSAALQALGQAASSCNFHLTVGQSEDDTPSSRNFLLDKARRIPALTFEVGSLAILIRERASAQDPTTNRMRLWGTLDVSAVRSNSLARLPEFWLEGGSDEGDRSETEEDDGTEPNDRTSISTALRQPRSGTTFHFDSENECWSSVHSPPGGEATLSALSVSSYNVLIDSEYPPARDRDSLLVETILSDSATADALILQEVSDDFLSYLLSNEDARRQYAFTSHGPPDQPDIGPLPSLRNIVILSRWYFHWEFVPFHRRHKGAVVATFPSLPFVVAGVHLTCGLTDGSVAAKKVQLQNITRYLKRNHADKPWVLAGDFNITTSKYTIDLALRDKSISQQTARTLESMELMIAEVGLLDAWSVTRVEATDESAMADADHLFEGEEGATFDPRENALAAATSGTSNNRPQRYDRILVRPQGLLRIDRFNHFGLPETSNGMQQVPSDHSGIRTSMKIQSGEAGGPSKELDMLNQYSVEHTHASAHLSHASDLIDALSKRQVFPTAEEEVHRKNAFELLKSIVLGSFHLDDSSTPDIPMVIVPVGSYALGVWTSISDIDCLCIGSISSKTFFRLARQRILRAESQGVRLLRKVEANTGTMLELSVNDISVDLQYCPAATIAQKWSDFPSLQASDPLFNLPILSLRKLKPVRDLSYIQRTLPSMASFRLAYHCIKLWAIERGIYSAKFGYLGGIHFALMLSWVCKRLAHDGASVSASDLIASFFHHYAYFDWEHEMVFDAFFHKKQPRYHRTAKEPMVVLGFHAPNSNIAHTATVPGLQTLVQEFRLADEQLSAPDMTWDKFFQGHEPAVADTKVDPTVATFLTSHESYVKIDIQYWGRTLSMGKGLVGWVESRCINLVVDIHKALPHLFVRIWPARFSDSDPTTSGAYYHGCYLIGLSRREPENTETSGEDRQHAKLAIRKTFDRFLAQVQADGKYYDPNSCWIGVSLAKPGDVKNMRLDNREWGDYVAEFEPNSDDEEASDDLTEEPRPVQKLLIRPSTSTPVSSSKLRPASDILNRLRWDPNLDPSDYIVGYEDRFLGAKETALEKWKTEQTDEEFIPQHRILYFKKKGEGGGEVVWERASRIDKMFGSGNSISCSGLNIAR